MLKKIVLISFTLLALSAKTAAAYYTSMPASTVIGQQNLTSGSANQGGSAAANTLNTPQGVHFDPVSKKLFVSDSSNNRVLIFNSLPTANNASADVVIGQSSFTATSANQGGSVAANTLSNPQGLMVVHGKLYIVDTNNHRVLVFNSIPTSNNAAADLVIGQANFTSGGNNRGSGSASPSQKSLQFPTNLASDGTRLVIADQVNNRALVFNTLPTTNDPAPDIVLGQSSFTTRVVNQGGIGANTLSNPTSVLMADGKLLVGDIANFRLLIWNTIPTTNKAAADVVVGQPNFTSNGGQPFGSNTRRPHGLAYDGKRLFITHDFTGVVSIRNGIPTQNFSPQQMHLGIANVTTLQNNTFWEPRSVTTAEGKVIVADSLHYHRILIFNDTTAEPSLSLSHQPEVEDNGWLTFTGTARVNSPYHLNLVEYSINGSEWKSATAVDGGFEEQEESFSFTFDPKANNNPQEGYVVQVRARNNNTDEVDRLTFFHPFKLNTPEHNTRTDNQFPTFSFSVNSQREVLQAGLQKYMVMVKKGREDWRTYIDQIPITHSGSSEGVYEDQKMKVVYSNQGSTLSVYAKPSNEVGDYFDGYLEEGGKKLKSGSYQWKVVALDNAGHTQETETRYVRIAGADSVEWFPLTLDAISGYGKVGLSSLSLPNSQQKYTLKMSSPVFSGIAFSDAVVSLELLDVQCQQRNQPDCVRIFSQQAGFNSQYSLALPAGTLVEGRAYQAQLFVSKDDHYTDLPPFTVSYGQRPNQTASLSDSVQEPTVLGEATDSAAAVLAPTQAKKTSTEQPDQNNEDESKNDTGDRLLFGNPALLLASGGGVALAVLWFLFTRKNKKLSSAKKLL